MTHKFSAFVGTNKYLISTFALLLSLGATVSIAGQTAPNLTLKKLDNSSFQISDLKGDVVYVDFWASCSEERLEMSSAGR